MFLHGDAERLLAHDLRLTQTSLLTSPFTRAGNYVPPLLLLISPPSLPADSFTSVTNVYVVCS